MVALLMTVLLSFCAFAVDVSNWYFTGQRAQRAADAAALGGVPYLPGNSVSAFAKAQDLATANDFGASAATSTTVSPTLDGRPTRLRVTVSRTVQNQFGWLLGMPTKTISRTAVADYAGPVPMGSPCNTFGDDPDKGGIATGTACSGVGQYWANVNAPATEKGQGDPAKTCSSAWDGCSGSTNTQYDDDGYFYTVSVATAGLSKLNIELFDPAFVNTGTDCKTNRHRAPQRRETHRTTSCPTRRVGTSRAPTMRQRLLRRRLLPRQRHHGPDVDPVHRSIPERVRLGPHLFPLVSGCQKTYVGFDGALYPALNKGSGSYNAAVVDSFRRWTTLCTINNPVKGDYLIQVKTNGLGTDGVIGSNHFSIRAYGSTATEANSVAMSGREKMSMDSNKPAALATFYLARVPSGAAGQLLKVSLFDVVTHPRPAPSASSTPPAGGAYSGCTGAGVTTAINSDCSFQVQPHRLQRQVADGQHPHPSQLHVPGQRRTACWVKLVYDYGASAAPTDITTWTASIEGDPVRLVE